MPVAEQIDDDALEGRLIRVLNTVAVGVEPDVVADLDRGNICEDGQVTETVALTEPARSATDLEQTSRVLSTTATVLRVGAGAVAEVEVLRALLIDARGIHHGRNDFVGPQQREHRAFLGHLMLVASKEQRHDRLAWEVRDCTTVLRLQLALTHVVGGNDVVGAVAGAFPVVPSVGVRAHLDDVATDRDAVSGLTLTIGPECLQSDLIAHTVPESQDEGTVAVKTDVRQLRRWAHPRVEQAALSKLPSGIVRRVVHVVPRVPVRGDVLVVGAGQRATAGEVQRLGDDGRERSVLVRVDGRRQVAARAGDGGVAHATDVDNPVMHAQAHGTPVSSGAVRARNGDRVNDRAGRCVHGYDGLCVHVHDVQGRAVFGQVNVAEAFLTGSGVEARVRVQRVRVRGVAGVRDRREQGGGTILGNVDGPVTARSVCGVALREGCREQSLTSPVPRCAVHRSGVGLCRERCLRRLTASACGRPARDRAWFGSVLSDVVRHSQVWVGLYIIGRVPYRRANERVLPAGDIHEADKRRVPAAQRRKCWLQVAQRGGNGHFHAVFSACEGA